MWRLGSGLPYRLPQPVSPGRRYRRSWVLTRDQLRSAFRQPHLRRARRVRARRDAMSAAASASAPYGSDKADDALGAFPAALADGHSADARSWRAHLAPYARPDSRRAAWCLATSVLPYLG